MSTTPQLYVVQINLVITRCQTLQQVNMSFLLAHVLRNDGGKKELVGVIYTVSQAWMKKYPDSRLRVGDLNASGHNSHRWGVAVDITISNQSAANTGGSRERNIELGKMFANTGLLKNIWFCDNTVNSEVVKYARANNLSLQQMSCVSGHNDHFHVDITPPRGPASTPGC